MGKLMDGHEETIRPDYPNPAGVIKEVVAPAILGHYRAASPMVEATILFDEKGTKILSIGAVIERKLLERGTQVHTRSASTRCACTISSVGDQAKMVNRPSCEATRAMESR
jgi:hypothetical protein